MDRRFSITLPPGVVKNDSAFAAKGRYIDSSFVRSFQGKMQKWGGWGNLNDVAFTEPARGGLVWNNFAGFTFAAFGTANKLWVVVNGIKYDITPQNLPAGLINTATTDSGWGAAGWGESPWGGSYTSYAGQGSFPRVWTLDRWGQNMVCCPRGGPVYYWEADFDQLGVTSSGNLNGTTTVSGLTNDTAISAGMRVTGTGIPANTFVVSVNTGAHTMVISNAATTTATVTLTFNMPAVALSTLTADAQLPSVALGIFVTDDRHLVVFGAAQSPNAYDPLNVAWCNREDFLTWTPSTTNTAGAIRCESGNQIMGAVKVFGGRLILTDLSAHPFTFVGGDDIFGLDRVGSQGGAIGPLAMAEMDGVGYWMGFGAHYRYNGRVEKMPCDVHRDVFENLSLLQAYKICAGTIRQFSEVIWFWTDLASLENNRAHAINVADMTWTPHSAVGLTTLSRTTWIDSNALFKTPLGTDGVNFKIYQHEAGTTADGSPISYLLETGELELVPEEGTIQATEAFLRLKKIVPDFAYVTGAHALTVIARGNPDNIVEKGPYTISSGNMFNPKARGSKFRFRYEGTGNMRLGDQVAWGAPDGGRA